MEKDHLPEETGKQPRETPEPIGVEVVRRLVQQHTLSKRATWTPRVPTRAACPPDNVPTGRFSRNSVPSPRSVDRRSEPRVRVRAAQGKPRLQSRSMRIDRPEITRR